VKGRRFGLAATIALAALVLLPLPTTASSPSGTTQPDSAYSQSYLRNHVSNVDATAQRTSCYTPEVAYFTNLGPAEGFSGMSACNGASNTGEDLGPYPNQQGSSAGYPASTPMLVKNHAESDIRIDPTNPNHLIGSSKWFVSSEGYNHVLGFYESFDGGASWPVQGHIPGYEGFTDDTDPVGAFDPWGNFYALILPYSFNYDSTGGHMYQKSKLPNPTLAPEVVSVSVRPHGATKAGDWSTSNGKTDYVAQFGAQGREPDKQWIAIDTNPNSPNYRTIYAMFVLFSFDGLMSKPYVSTATANQDGTHTPWSPIQVLPTGSGSASDTYLLPHVDGDGTVWTTVTNFPSTHQRSTYNVNLIWSKDAGRTWQGPLAVTPAQAVALAPFSPGYVNTTFRSGISNSFGVGAVRGANGVFPLYVTWEDAAGGIASSYVTYSADGGQTWSGRLLVNDNASPADEFQPSVAAGPSGTVAVTFYDRRLPCPSAGTSEAARAGIALDTVNQNGYYGGGKPPYGAANYCINTSIQLYSAALAPLGHNIRLSGHTWDPELNSAHWINAASLGGFIGDYFGIELSATKAYVTSVSTFDDGGNPGNRQQQVVAAVAIP